MFENKKVLVIGMGVSGVSCIRGLSKLGAEIYAYDDLPKDKLEKSLNELKDINVIYYLDDNTIDVSVIDIAVKSPGIKYESPIVQKLLVNNVKVISDIEAAYLITQATVVSITGTNGKTTTTTLIGEIVKESNKAYKLTGNIGYGIFNDAIDAKAGDILVAEVSSFQLAGTFKYKPHVGVITNITPDHMDWHHTYEKYIEAKFNNVKNQDENDFAVLNYEDKVIRKFSDKIRSKKIFFSSQRPLDEGIFVENEKIILKYGDEIKFIMNVSDIFIPGKHNVENALAAVGAAYALNIDMEVVSKVLRRFRGVEHRLEYCGEYNGMNFYNDSKGTNPDASIKAVEGIKKPIVLIAGGYDKKSKYDEFVKTFEHKVKALILLGQTADDIEDCARSYGFNNIYKVKNMDEAVKTAFEISIRGDNVLLSPACASWGMYPNYEVRGKDFKERVKFYGGISTKS